MKIETTILHVSETAGSVSAEYTVPDKSDYILTLAHGAGAGMHHSFMLALANSLAEKDIATLRFNFPFMENKKRRTDVPAVAHQTIDAAIRAAREKFPSLPLFVSGKSFGGRMSSQHLALKKDEHVSGIIFFGFPLHPAGKPGTERAEHLSEVIQPMLFLQGTRDELATWNLVEGVCKSLPAATLVKIEGADHAFKAGKINTIEILAEAARKWMEQLRPVKGM
jgi:predicted alpha/beta-hydrolase family hydrolase